MTYKRQNAVQMVRHDHKLVQHQPREPLYQRNPFAANNLARAAENNAFPADGTENGTLPGRTNSDKIDARKCIVIATRTKLFSVRQYDWIVHLLNVAGRASPAPTGFAARRVYYSSLMTVD